MKSNENDPHLTAKIVGKYVAHHRLAADQLSDLIITIHRAIGQLGQPSEPEEVLTPAVSVRRSVHHGYVVCLGCGYRGKTLRRHINVRHGLTPDEYRRRWGLKNDHPLTAPAYSERRSVLSKALGFGRKPSIVAAPPETPAPATIEAEQSEAKPAAKRRARSAPKSATVASEPVAEAKPTRARRSRRVAHAEQPTSTIAESSSTDSTGRRRQLARDPPGFRGPAFGLRRFRRAEKASET
jgi:predicted transcriptional regulator